MNSLQDYSIATLLPESLKKDPFVVALGEAVEKELKEAYREAESMSNFSDVDKLPEPLLDYLAHQKHVDFYDNTLPIEKKRGLVKNATMWHRKKGTKWAVEQVVSLIFNNSQVTEWFEYGGNPYFFRVETEQALTDETEVSRLVKLIDSAKNRRSWLENVTIKRTNDMNLFASGVVSEWKKTDLETKQFTMPDLLANQQYRGFISAWNQTEIYMEVNHEWLTTRVLF